MKRDSLLFSLALCRKAGKLAIGFDAAEAAVKSKTAFGVVVALDASDRTARTAERFSEMGDVPFYRINRTQAQIGEGVGRPFAVAAVTGHDLCDLVIKNIKQESEE